MKGKRIFDGFGFNAPKTLPKDALAKLLTEYREWEYDPKSSDWIDAITVEVRLIKKFNKED